MSIVLAAACALVAAGVFLPRAAARATVLARITVLPALVLAAVIWVAGQALGMILAGGATDPNSGLLLALIALAYWPARARPGGAPP